MPGKSIRPENLPSKSSKKLLLIIAATAIILTVAGLAVYFFNDNNSSQQTPTTTNNQPQVKVENQNNLIDWQLSDQPELGISFYYPLGWRIFITDQNSLAILSPGLTYDKDIPPAGLLISRSYDKASIPDSAQQIMVENKTGYRYSKTSGQPMLNLTVIDIPLDTGLIKLSWISDDQYQDIYEMILSSLVFGLGQVSGIPNDWPGYSNSQFGFSFNYPAGFNSVASNQLALFQKGSDSISLSITSAGSFAAQEESEKLEQSTADITISGLSGYKFSFQDAEQRSFHYRFKLDGQILLIDFNSDSLDQRLTDQIISTLEFVN